MKAVNLIGKTKFQIPAGERPFLYLFLNTASLWVPDFLCIQLFFILSFPFSVTLKTVNLYRNFPKLAELLILIYE